MSGKKHIFKIQKGEKLNIENSNEELYKIKLVKDDQEIKLCSPYLGDYTVETGGIIVHDVSHNGSQILHYLIEIKDNKLVEGKIDCNKAKVKVVLDGDQYRLALYESDNSPPIILPKASLKFKNHTMLFDSTSEMARLLAECKTHYDLEKYYNNDDSLIFKVEALPSYTNVYGKHIGSIQEKNGEKICLLYNYPLVLDSDGRVNTFHLEPDSNLFTWKLPHQYFTIEENEIGNHEYYLSDKNGDPIIRGWPSITLKDAIQDSACFSMSEIIKPQHDKDLSGEQLEYLVGSFNEHTLKDLTDKLCSDQLKEEEDQHKGIIDECREKNKKQVEVIERLERLLSDKDPIDKLCNDQLKAAEQKYIINGCREQNEKQAKIIEMLIELLSDKDLDNKLCGNQLKTAEDTLKGIINKCREQNEKQAETIERLEGLLSDKDLDNKPCYDQLNTAEHKCKCVIKVIIDECREKNKEQVEMIERLEGLLSDREPKIDNPNTVIKPEPTELMTAVVLNQDDISIASHYSPFYVFET